MTTINELNFVTLVADADTPASLQSLHGKVVGVPPSMVVPLPTAESRWDLYGIWGYAQVNATSGGTEWVMCDRVSRTLRQGLNRIPGAEGWLVADSRMAYRQLARDLLDRGHTETEIVDLLTRAYQAAAAEAKARGG